MNDAIVDSINGRVAMDDELYILGDFSFKMTAQDAYGLRSESPAGVSTSSRETTTRTGPGRRSRVHSPWSRRSACSRSTGRRLS